MTRNFNGGESLLKNLANGDGLREIRITAYYGGTIRILFKLLEEGKQVLLVGFIKKGDNDGYKESMDHTMKFIQNIKSPPKLERHI